MDSMLIGTEHNHRVLPDCSTPPVRELTRNAANLSDDEKTNIVINDPKFGMFSLFEYHLTSPQLNRFRFLVHRSLWYRWDRLPVP